MPNAGLNCSYRMSQEDIEALRHGFEMLNMKMEKPKFHKILRQPGPERLLFLQKCLSQLCVEGRQHFVFIHANDLEGLKELEEELVKYIAAYGISKERRIITGYGSEHDNLLFWKRLLVLMQRYQASRNGDTSPDWKKYSGFMAELLQHPQLEVVLKPRKKEPLSDCTPDNSLSEVNLLQTKENESQKQYCSTEQSVPPALQEQERNCNSISQRMKENLQLLQKTLKDFKEGSNYFPRVETSNLTCMGEAMQQQCTQLNQITNFYSDVQKIESAVDFLTSIEPPEVTATDAENLLFCNSNPDLLNGLP